MVQVLNQYSFLISALFLLAFLGGVMFFSPQRKRAGLILAVGVLGVALSWLDIRPSASTYSSSAAVRALIGAGKPVLIEFQSPF